MIRTTGRLSFTSGYTTKVSTDRPSCFKVTHSPWRGDLASAALAQSCAETVCANAKISRSRNARFIVSPLWQARIGQPRVVRVAEKSGSRAAALHIATVRTVDAITAHA